jgi:HPt (histidine-containing phosphotransfer) domain-containing protein
MTANAMRGDREMSLAAGMNDHVAKPILLQDLAAAIERWLPIPSPQAVQDHREHEPTPPEEHPRPVAFDREGLLERVGGDRELFDEIVRMAAADFPAILDQLREAAAAGDSERARMHAHSIKGAAANVGAVALHLEAAAAETRAKAGGVPAIEPLEDAYRRFCAAIDEGSVA